MIFDFHTHANYADGANSAVEMVKAAIAKGLSVLGFAEHHPRHPDFRYRDDPPGEVRGLKVWPDYIAEIDRLKGEYDGKIEILKGSEFDWLSNEKPHLEEWKKWRAETDWDYVIGSVHYIGHWGFDYLGDWEHRRDFPELKENKGILDYDSMEQIYGAYYRSVTEMVESASGLFQIVGHFDLIKKFVKDVPPNATELALPTLDTIAKTDLVVEINSAGWEKECAEQYPSLPILKAARERNIPITLNSDAHSIDRIAENFGKSKKLVKNAGYEEVTIFHQKGEREVIKI